MSKPWFLDNPLTSEGQQLRETIRSTIGRDLGDVGSVVKEAERNGKTLQNGDGDGSGHGADQTEGLNLVGNMSLTLPAGLTNPVALASS